jgi:hypothetical protein
MNALKAFNRCVEVHADISSSPQTYTVNAINDFDNYIVDVAEAMIAEVCNADLPMVEREAALVRLRVLAEIRMQLNEVMVRKAFGMTQLSVPLKVH